MASLWKQRIWISDPEDLRNDWSGSEVNLTELSLKGNVFKRKRIERANSQMYSQLALLFIAIFKETGTYSANRLKPNYFEQCWIKNIKMLTVIQCVLLQCEWYDTLTRIKMNLWKIQNLLTEMSICQLSFVWRKAVKETKICTVITGIVKSEEKATNVI